MKSCCELPNTKPKLRDKSSSSELSTSPFPNRVLTLKEQFTPKMMTLANAVTQFLKRSTSRTTY